MHQWRGTMLHLPAGAVDLVEEEVAGLDHLEPTNDADVVGAPSRPNVARPRPDARYLGAVLAVVYVPTGLAMRVLVYEYERRIGDGAVRVIHPTVTGATVYACLVVAYATASVTVLGWTPGMGLAGVEVVRVDGRRLGWLRSFVRAILALGWLVVPSLLVAVEVSHESRGLPQNLMSAWFLVIFASIGLGRDGRGLHGRVVGSVVRPRGSDSE